MAHASQAVKPGRSYTHRLIELLAATKPMDQFMRLNQEARADIEWWHAFAATWNRPAMMLTSNATGNCGCG